MAKHTLLICSCVFCMTLAAAFTPEEARRVYGEASISSTSSFVEQEDYVFMEIKWKAEADASDEERDAQELAAIMDAIEKYVEPPKPCVTNSPFCKELTSWLLPESPFSVPNVASTTVKDDESNGEHRMVVAFDAKALRDAKSKAASAQLDLNARTDAEWTAALSSAYNNFKTPDEKRKFFYMLGCPIVAFLDSGIGITKAELATRTDVGSKELMVLLDWKPSTGSVFIDYPMLSWASCRDANQGVFFPSWQESDGGSFAEAEKLYLKGQDIPKIIALLADSISKNPVGALKWEYLGGVLRASNRHHDAIIAYMQSLLMNGNSAWAWKGLADSMKKAGMDAHSRGLTWYLRMKGFVK